jgi:hypothetical protein
VQIQTQRREADLGLRASRGASGSNPAVSTVSQGGGERENRRPAGQNRRAPKAPTPGTRESSRPARSASRRRRRRAPTRTGGPGRGRGREKGDGWTFEAIWPVARWCLEITSEDLATNSGWVAGRSATPALGPAGLWLGLCQLCQKGNGEVYGLVVSLRTSTSSNGLCSPMSLIVGAWPGLTVATTMGLH